MTIYLEPNEEITSVIDHLINSEESEMVFVAPIGAQILQSLINLRLLKREADNLNKKIIIITQDEMGQKLARKAGLELSAVPEKSDSHVDFQVALTATPHRKIKVVSDNPPMVFDIKKGRYPYGISPEGRQIHPFHPPHQEVEKIERTLKPPQSKLLPFKFLTLFASAIIGISLLIFLFFTLPKAEIILQSKLEPVNNNLTVKIDSNIKSDDYGRNIIAGQLIKLEKNTSREFGATGERQLNEKASGKIIIYNAYSSAPQTLVATTRFLSESGKIFRIVKTIIVPGAKIEEGKIISSSMEAEVVADEPGESFNIAPANFTIPGFQGTPKYKAFYAKSEEAMKGGAVGKAKVISSEDVEKAKETMAKLLRESVRAQIKKDTPAGYKLFDFAIVEKSLIFSVSPEIGSPAEKFNVNLKMVLEGILFAEEGAQKLVIMNISNQLPSNQEFIDKSLFIDYKLIDIDFNAGIIDLSLSFSGNARAKLDLELIRKQIAGKKREKIQEMLSIVPGVASVKIKLWPFWVKSAPKDLNKIKIGVDPIK